MATSDDWREPLRRLAEEPLVQAAAVVGSAALLGFFHWRQVNGTPKQRAAYEKIRSDAKADSTARTQMRERGGRLLHYQQQFFASDAVRARLEADHLVEVGPEPVLPDAEYRYLPAGFRHAKLEITSRAADARLTLNWDVADRDGSFELTRPGRPDWGFGAVVQDDAISTYRGTKIDLAAARLACRLLTVIPDGRYHRLRLWREGDPNRWRIELLREHMRANPEIARDLGWKDYSG